MLDRDRFLDPTAPESTLLVAGTTPCVILRARGVSEHSENGHWTGDGHDRISLVGPTANQRCRQRLVPHYVRYRVTVSEGITMAYRIQDSQIARLNV